MSRSVAVLYLLVIIFVGAVRFLPGFTSVLDVSAHAINAPLVWDQGMTGTGFGWPLWVQAFTAL